METCVPEVSRHMPEFILNTNASIAITDTKSNAIYICGVKNGLSWTTALDFAKPGMICNNNGRIIIEHNGNVSTLCNSGAGEIGEHKFDGIFIQRNTDYGMTSNFVDMINTNKGTFLVPLDGTNVVNTAINDNYLRTAVYNLPESLGVITGITTEKGSLYVACKKDTFSLIINTANNSVVYKCKDGEFIPRFYNDTLFVVNKMDGRFGYIKDKEFVELKTLPGVPQSIDFCGKYALIAFNKCMDKTNNINVRLNKFNLHSTAGLHVFNISDIENVYMRDFINFEPTAGNKSPSIHAVFIPNAINPAFITTDFIKQITSKQN